jgi:hypothetical protein
MTNSKFGGPRSVAIFSLAVCLLVSGCKSTPKTAPMDDATLTGALQDRIASDQSIATQPIQASVVNGVATLNGSVNSDANRLAAAADAAQVAGVRTVVNNLTVQPISVSAAVTTPAPAPVPVVPVKKPSATIPQPHSPATSVPIERSAPTPQPAADSAPAPNPAVAQVQASVQPPAPVPAAPPPPPPAPVVHTITVPSGTTLPVRITQTLDSGTTQTGEKFTGAIASDIVIDGMVVLPQGTPVTGHVDAVQDAAHFKGSSLLTISLSAINHKGEHITVSTDSFTKEGEGRGKNTAEKVGGGAVVGAILGGILGGGKGAAIGSAAGAGVGAGAQGVTRGQQVQIESETLVRFRLADAITVRVGGPNSSVNQSTQLEHHTDQ